MSTRAEVIAVLVKNVQETEHKYLLHGPRHDPVRNPWMPYQPADFIGILWECLPEISFTAARPPMFLDVGCGPGTKMDIAATLFAFSAYGIEADEAMAGVAQARFGDKVTCADALSGTRFLYDAFDVIWLYRPFRDPVSEARLEQKVIDGMKPGAILAGSSWEVNVPALGWQPIVDDCLISPDGHNQIIRGAWQKPRVIASD